MKLYGTQYRNIFLPMLCNCQAVSFIVRRIDKYTYYGLYILLDIYLFCMYTYVFNFYLQPILSSIKSRPTSSTFINVMFCFETGNIFDKLSVSLARQNLIHRNHFKHTEIVQIVLSTDRRHLLPSPHTSSSPVIKTTSTRNVLMLILIFQYNINKV